MKEKIAKMKLCILCRDNTEWPYTEINAELHDKHSFHFTLGNTWKPEKGHARHEEHIKWINLLNNIKQ